MVQIVSRLVRTRGGIELIEMRLLKEKKNGMVQIVSRLVRTRSAHGAVSCKGVI